MATATASMSVPRTASQEQREQCIAFLGNGHSIDELPEQCKEILGANSKVGLLARRNSSVGRVWSPGDGHNSRSYAEQTFGSPYDVPSGTPKTVGELFLEGAKSPEHAEKIKRTIARTASRGARIRTEELVSDSEVQNEQKMREMQRRASRENRQ